MRFYGKAVFLPGIVSIYVVYYVFKNSPWWMIAFWCGMGVLGWILREM